MMAVIRPRGSRTETDTAMTSSKREFGPSPEGQQPGSGTAGMHVVVHGAVQSEQPTTSRAVQVQQDAPIIDDSANKHYSNRTQPSKCAVSRSGTQFRNWQTQPDELTAVRSMQTRQRSEKSRIKRSRTRSNGSRGSRLSRKRGSRRGDPRLYALAKFESSKTAALGALKARESAEQKSQPMVKDFSVIDFREESMLKPQSKPVRRHSARTTRSTPQDQNQHLGGRYRSVKEHSSTQQKREGARKPLHDVFQLDDILIEPNSIAYC